MFKKARKILIITLCLIMIGSVSIFADTTTENLSENEATKEPIFTVTVEGYTFTYENAPQPIKDSYEKTCAELGVEPKASDEIFIPIEGMSKYSMYKAEARKDNYTIGFYNTFFDVSGSKNYQVYVTTYVGYGHTTSGNAVHLVQLMINRTGVYLNVDSIFGTNTYNKVKSFQSKYGLTSDGVVGLGTWKKFADVLRLYA